MKDFEFYLPRVDVQSHMMSAMAGGQQPQWGIPYHKIEQWWAKGITGKGSTGWALDTGAAPHVDLPPIPESNYSDDKGAVTAYHGSHVLGIMGALNNDQGVVGVAPGGALFSDRVMRNSGSGMYSWIVKALRDKVVKIKRMGGRHVLNMSLGGPQADSIMHDLIKELRAIGVPVTCSAGNSGNAVVGNMSYPGAFPETIAVGSHDEQGKPSKFSSTSKAEALDIMAPGDGILSTVPVNLYQYLSGTSMAGPFVAGLIMLMFEAKPSLTVDDVEGLIKSTAIDMNAKGYDVYTGHGMINPPAILAELTKTVVVKPEPKPTEDDKIKVALANLDKAVDELKSVLD